MDSAEEILVRFALELKYTLDPVRTRKVLSDLYVTETGKSPTKKTKLLDWFFANYVYDGIDTWYHKDDLSKRRC